MGRPIFCTVPAVRRRRLADPRRALGHLAPDLSRWLVLAQPEPAAPLTMIAVAAIGALINGATALLFISGRKQDLNIRGAFLHMAFRRPRYPRRRAGGHPDPVGRMVVG
jgi:hypothetical protein